MNVCLSVLTLSIRFIVLGIVIILFFQCMDRLLNPAHRRMEGIKWGLVAHTVAMFSAVTVYTAMSLNILSDCYIDNREFPGVDGVLPPGPSGYRFLIYSGVISLVPNVMFLLNNWLADGLLVSLVANSVVRVSNSDRSSSSIVATLCTARTTG